MLATRPNPNPGRKSLSKYLARELIGEGGRGESRRASQTERGPEARAMAGFRQPELPRAQQVLWTERLDDALPPDHPVRLFDQLLRISALAAIRRGRRPGNGNTSFAPGNHPTTRAIWRACTSTAC